MSYGFTVPRQLLQKIEDRDFHSHGITRVPALGRRALGRGPRIFGWPDVAVRSDVLDNAMLVLQRLEFTFNTPQHHRAGQNRNDACGLRV